PAFALSISTGSSLRPQGEVSKKIHKRIVESTWLRVAHFLLSRYFIGQQQGKTQKFIIFDLNNN
ncbi:MAG: hypothetical protein Q4G48_06165, partial [Bacteroidia bacterium]|nr:hypothetical protein [Bacteroidia bacterium]